MSVRWWAVAGTFVAVAAAVTWVSVSTAGPPPDGRSPAPRPAAEITAAGLVSPQAGWAMAPDRLLWTDDGGAGWREITPAVPNRIAHRGATFLDRNRAWVVTSRQAGPAAQVELLASRTVNGGRSWQHSIVAPANPMYSDAAGAPAYVRFIDADHGWILAKASSSANFSVGELFATTDGGRTWTRRDAPLGEPVTFLDPSTGWAAGGVRGDELYLTRDGGTTWTPQHLPVPPGETITAHSTPQPVDRTSAALAVTVTNPSGGSRVRTFLTTDAGRSWNEAQPPNPIEGRVITAETAGLPDGASEIDFAGPDAAWALVGNLLYATDDGGRSWHEVTP